MVANTIPYVNTASLSLTGTTTIIDPPSTVVFTTADASLPVPDAQFESSVQYYEGRYDTVGLSSSGTVIVNRGIASATPVPPSNVPNGMTLGTMFIPPYPSITPDLVDSNMRRGYPTTSFTYNYNRRYTMADIGSLDRRISQVEYYTSLSLLEQSAQNLLLTNVQGQNRFQNGMLADPMQDFSIANTADPAFNIAIDSVNSVARPTFTQMLDNLIFNTALSTNVTLSNNGRLITMNYTQAGPMISQQFASHERNCAQDILYVWSGTLTLNPDGDYFPDVTTNPTVAVSLNNYSNWVNLVNGWNTQWGTWNETSSSISQSGSQITDTNTTTTTTSSIGITAQNNSYSFGDVVTSISLQPFCRANLIKFTAFGLKPSTHFWSFLNDIAVSAYCIQTDVNFNPLNTGTMITDSNGTLYGYFYLPASTFNTGALNFQLMDISNLVTQSDIITSLASATYYGTNLAYSQNNLTLDTTEPQFSFNSVSSTSSTSTTVAIPAPTIVNNITNVTNVTNPPTTTVPAANYGGTTSSGGGLLESPGAGGSTMYTGVSTNGQSINITVAGNPTNTWGDPIGQAFSLLPSAFPNGVEAIYITSIDVFFAAKDSALGITLDVRPIENGMPTDVVLPFSLVHLVPSQINTSTDSSVVTNIQFPAPVLLEVGSSYMFVLTPDGSNPNYDVYTAEIGKTDILSQGPIYSLAATGDMFMSSQGSTWTPYQSEALKFNVYIANFNQFYGTAVFNNDDSDYVYIANNFGNMNVNDTLYFGNMSNDHIGTGTSNTSNTVTVTSTAGITTSSIIGITSINNQTSIVANVVSIGTNRLVLSKIPFATGNTDAAAIIYNVTPNQKGVVGTGSNTSFLRIANSTATTSKYLSNNYNYAIIDSNSGAFVTSTQLLDLPYDTIMPKFSTSIPSLCAINLSMNGISNSSTYTFDTMTTPLPFGTSKDFFDQERVVMSKSNEMRLNKTKSLTFTGTMFTNISLESPVFDMIKAGAVLVYNTVVAETSTNTMFTSEITNSGKAFNRYISTSTTLASGLSAEDLQVYIGAYYPANTEVYVYAKIMNQYDPDSFVNKLWTPMYTTNTQRSSKLNTSDFNEYIFKFGTSPVATYDAYSNVSNNNVVTYTSPAGIAYSTYNVFAIKIILLADASMNVPFVTDLRAIALS